MARNKLFKLLTATFISTACIAGIINLQLPKIQAKEVKKNINHTKQEELLKVKLDLLKKMPGFGFGNLIADWAFLDFVQYYGDNIARNATGYSLAPDYFEVIVKKDPRFVDGYLYLSPATSLFAGKPDKSVALVTEGLKSLSAKVDQSYLVWTYKAVDELLFLGKTKEARNSYLTAADWAKQQDNETSKNIRLRAEQTAKFLATNPDSKKARASAWMMILGNARDEKTRLIALRQIEQLGAEIIITPQKVTVKFPEDKQS